MDKPKVAVIAIHGVGEHKPDATSASVAAQLQYFYPEEFKAFECAPLHIAVDAAPLQISPDCGGTTQTRSERVPKSVSARAISDLPQRDDIPTDIAFTGITLAGGEGYKASYSTTRLRCDVHGHGGIDLYEMFWSDLSHGGTKGGLRVLREMLQLFLHMACLGRTALSTLLAAPGRHPATSRLSHAYAAAAWGYWVLAVPIALGNLLLLCLGAAFLGLLVPDGTVGTIGTAIAVAILAATLVGVVWRWMMRNEQLWSPVERMGLPLVWVAMLSIPAVYMMKHESWSMRPADVAFLPALAIALGAGTFVALRYKASRPGANIWWCIMVASCLLWCVVGVIKRWSEPINWLALLALVVEGNFLWLVFWWGTLALTNLWLLVAGTRAKHADPADEAVRRAVNTSLVAATVPASLLLIVVLTLWLGIKHVLDPCKFTLMNRTVDLLVFGSPTVEQLIGKFIDLSAGRTAIVFLLLMVAALVGVLIAIVPSVVAELFPPEKPRNDARSLALWRWLNQGFRLLPTGKWLTVVAFFILLPAGTLWQYVAADTNPTLPDVGATIGVSALAFVSVTRLFGTISLSKVGRTFARMRVAIDTAIDVDNWLRERPVGQTPRLRIMARYVSLLRHLQQEGYERIVVVGHSQGTVITVDLLRYLKARGAPLLKQLGPIDLLTFGSPLRQLYAARFPALYGWVLDLSHDQAKRQARLCSWTNGYGSGDYVGRNLWNRMVPAQPWQCGTGQDPYEFCTGALAHTHYFDERAPDVAAAVWDAIRIALASVRPTPLPP
ncbi:hypothetical protein [Massilia putida]|uniref:hypothetical protein n=1 Tax=Massilia putida TaxID=1141883 RepID=UPI0012EC7BBD|nr:hypothetical protein [Massilia putida]